MTKRVPALERAIRILRLLSEQPNGEFTLSELASRANVNLSTCHGILACLAEEGMVLRHEPKRTYALGPLLAELGAAAMNHHLGLADAQEALARLTERFGIPGSVGARIGDEVLVLAHTTADGRTPEAAQGFRAPMTPPGGAVFMAWADSAEVEHWLSHLGRNATPEDREHYQRVLEQTRQRGCLIVLNRTLGEATVQYAARFATTKSTRARNDLVHELTEILRSTEYAMVGYPQTDFIACPVFGPNGDVVLTVTVQTPNGTMPLDRVDPLAEALLKECKGVTARIGGRYPAAVAV